MFTSAEYTDLRDRPKRWWGFAILSRWTGHGILLPAAAVAVGAALLIAGPAIFWSEPARWPVPFIVGGVLAVLIYALWNANIRIDGASAMHWALQYVDHRMFQPKRFNGVSRDDEPLALHWTVVVYDPATNTKTKTKKKEA